MSSLIKRITERFSSVESINFLNLDYHTASEDAATELKDIARVKLKETQQTSPLIMAKPTIQPQVPVIGIGGAGLRILSKFVDRIQAYEGSYPTLGLDCDHDNLNQYTNITRKLPISGDNTGTGHQFRKAASRVEKSKAIIKEQLNSYFNEFRTSYSHEMVFLVMGAGGTGIGAGIEIAKILLEMGKRPVPFLILPSKEEMTRIRFNAAVGLYYFSYAPKDRCLNLTTICIDNELFLTKNSKKYFKSVIHSSNERIAATIADLIIASQAESHAYSSDLNEFLEVFRNVKGIGALQFMQVDDLGVSPSVLFEKNRSQSMSLEVDPYTSTRSYIFFSSKHKFLEAQHLRDVLQKYRNSDIFTKLHETQSEFNFFAVRGVYTGFRLPDHIEELMRLAEDSRVEVLNRETSQLNEGRVNPKIEKLTGEDEIDVKTGQELANSRSS